MLLHVGNRSQVERNVEILCYDKVCCCAGPHSPSVPPSAALPLSLGFSPVHAPPPHRHPLSSRVRGLRRARPLHLYNCKLLKSKRHNMYLFAAPGSQYLICCFEMKVITFYPFEDKWNDSQR